MDVYVNISSHKLKLLFEMIPGVKTSNFVGELFRAMEGKALWFSLLRYLLGICTVPTI